MITRREFLQASVAASAIYGASGFGNWSRLAAQQALTQDQLLQFDDFGNVTLIHITDIHAQLKPIWFREPEWNIGVGDAKGQPPHVSGRPSSRCSTSTPGSARRLCADLSRTSTALGKTYGKMGGMDRVATVVKAIRAARPDALLLDGGDTWHGLLHLPQDRRAGHGQRHEPAEARRDDLALGIHPWHRPGDGDRRKPGFPLPWRQHLRRRMGRTGLSSPTRCSNAAASRSR